MNLAQRASPKFAVAVSKRVFEWMQGNVKSPLPPHIERYILNHHKIPPTHFSILNEMTFALIAPLEKAGYTIKEKLVPDISEGKMFCAWLRKVLNIEPKTFPKYQHTYPDGRVFDANLYPNHLLGHFRDHFYKEWMLKRSIEYFTEKDPTALPYLHKIINMLPNDKRKELK